MSSLVIAFALLATSQASTCPPVQWAHRSTEAPEGLRGNVLCAGGWGAARGDAELSCGTSFECPGSCPSAAVLVTGPAGAANLVGSSRCSLLEGPADETLPACWAAHYRADTVRLITASQSVLRSRPGLPPPPRPFPPSGGQGLLSQGQQPACHFVLTLRFRDTLQCACGR